MKFFLDFCINERKPNILFVIYMTTQNMNKEPNWTLEDVDSEDEIEIDDNTSLKFSSLTSSSPRSSPRSSTTSPRTTTASPRTTTSSPFPQYDELNIDISNIEATPIDEKIVIERTIDKQSVLNGIIDRILNQKIYIHANEYESLLIKLIRRGLIIQEDILYKMKNCEIKDNYNCYLIERLLEEYQKIHPSGGKRYTRKTKKSSKKTKKIPGKFRKHKKSRKSRKSKKFPGKFQNAIKKKR
jgi:hypothetical protein